MCGIVLLYGPDACQRLSGCLAKLNHRGPDDQAIWLSERVAFGFARLAINGDISSGRQPVFWGDRIAAINGEIYNHRELVDEFALEKSESDIRVVLPLFELVGSRIIDILDGFYAAIIFSPETLEVICLRDHMGKKPLFFGGSQSELFIISELKVLDQVDWFVPLPLGATKVDLTTGNVTLVAAHCSQPSNDPLPLLLERAIKKRLPRHDQPVGVFLSGGLDSSIIAAYIDRFRKNATYFVLGDLDSPDVRAVEILSSFLKLKDVRRVPLPTSTEIAGLIRSVVYTTESYNPSIISNGLATYLLARAARSHGISVIITGEGADELFGGYHLFGENDPWQDIRDRLIRDMQFTELRRLDLASMAHSVEARCPFLDLSVRSFSEQLGYNDLYSVAENKVFLRQSFQEILLPSILHRRKTSFDVGSGLRRVVVDYLRRNGRTEKEELLDEWRQFFSHDASHPYFHSYPVFDSSIDSRGHIHK